MRTGEAEGYLNRAQRTGSGSFRRRTEKISETVAREIVRRIRDMPPNTMLPSESEMLEEYGVGRASLREALRILEVQGLLTIRPGPGGGPMVAEPDGWNFARMATLHLHVAGATYRDVIEARIVMEPVMARLAAERQDTEVLARLQAHAELPDPTDDASYLQSTSGFHSLVSSMSANVALDLYGHSLKDIYASRIESIVFPEDARDRVAADHRRIADCIVDGKSAAAESLMREHMQEFLTWSAEKYPGMLDEVVDWA